MALLGVLSQLMDSPTGIARTSQEGAKTSHCHHILTASRRDTPPMLAVAEKRWRSQTVGTTARGYCEGGERTRHMLCGACNPQMIHGRHKLMYTR